MKKIFFSIAVIISSASLCAQDIFDAINNSDTGKVQLLVREAPDLVNARNPNEQTPLHFAVIKSNLDIIKFLTEHGAAVDVKNKMALTPFYYAALSGNKEIMDYLLANGANKKDLELRNPWGRTPLCAVSRDGGNPEVIKTLIAYGADINAKDNSGWSPIQLAAWRPNKDVVDVLTDAGADLEIGKDGGKRLFFNALSHGLEKLFARMISQGMSVDPDNAETKGLIISAAGGGSKKITEFLINKGWDVNYKDEYGWAPIHLAAEQGHKEIISLLLKNGADINIRNMLGQSAYNIAVEREDPELANYLKSLKSDTSDPKFPKIEGKYLGQTAPGNTPAPFGSGIIFHRYNPHSTVAISPEGDEIFWNPMVNPRGGGYSYGYLMSTRLENGVWTYPEKVTFSEKEYRDDHPVFSHDGRRLYFASDRPVDKLNPQDSQKRIWYVEKNQNGWSEPKVFGEQPSPRTASEMFFTFSFDRDGNYYSMDGREIFCARYENGKYLPPEKLSKNINTGELIGAPYISPDGTFLIFYKGKPFVSFKKKDGTWTDGVDIENVIGKSLNYSFSGDYLFAGFRGNSWVSINVVEELRPDNEPYKVKSSVEGGDSESAAVSLRNYLGQHEPGILPELFAPGLVSTGQGVHGNIVFNSDFTEAAWHPNYMVNGKSLIYIMKYKDGNWGTPIEFFPKEGFNYSEPFYSYDGNKLFFLSGETGSSGHADNEKIYYVERSGEGWTEPKLLSSVLPPFHWQFSLDKNNNLYFGGKSADKKAEIYFSEFKNGTYSIPMPLSENVNSEFAEFSPFISPDNKYIVFTRMFEQQNGPPKTNLFVSFKDENGNWTKAYNLSSDLTLPEKAPIEIMGAPRITPDGKFLFFCSFNGKGHMVYWISTKIIDELKR